MQEYLKGPLSVHLRRAAMAVLASGAVAATTVAKFDVTDPARIKGECSAQLSTFTGAIQDDAPPARDYPVIDTLTEYELSRMFDVKRVRVESAKGDTGTSLMMIPPK